MPRLPCFREAKQNSDSSLPRAALGAKRPVAQSAYFTTLMAADYRSELDAAEAAKVQPSAAPTASEDGAPTVMPLRLACRSAAGMRLRRHPVRLTSRNPRRTRCCGSFSNKNTLLNDEGAAIRLTTCPLRGGLRGH